MNNKVIYKIIISIFIISVGLIVVFASLSNPANLSTFVLTNSEYEPDESEAEEVSSSKKSNSTSSKKASTPKVKSVSSKKLTSSKKSSSSKTTTSSIKEQTSSFLDPNRKYNVNTVTFEELISINSIGEKTAQSIIDFREQAGGFESLEDLLGIPGIGPQKFAILSQYLYYE